MEGGDAGAAAEGTEIHPTSQLLAIEVGKSGLNGNKVAGNMHLERN